MSNRGTVSLSTRPANMGHKIPYVDIISDAIFTSPFRRLTAKEIFDHVSAKFGPMKSTETLKNTIRHTLSRYKIFRKVQRGTRKKPNWWTIDEDGANQIEDLQQEAPIIARSTPVQRIAQTEAEAVCQQGQDPLEVGDGGRKYSAPGYLSQPTCQRQFPEFFYSTASQPPKENELVEANSGTGNGDIYPNAYGAQVTLAGPTAPGPSHHSGYGLPPIEEAVSYMFPYQMNADMPTAASALAVPTSSPVPEYYQM